MGVVMVVVLKEKVELNNVLVRSATGTGTDCRQVSSKVNS